MNCNNQSIHKNLGHPRFLKFKDRGGNPRFLLTAKNGRIILDSSESYSGIEARDNGIQSVQSNAANDDRYDRLRATNGQYYFNLMAAGNIKVIGISQMYTTARARENGIEAVKKYSQEAGIKEI